MCTPTSSTNVLPAPKMAKSNTNGMQHWGHVRAVKGS